MENYYRVLGVAQDAPVSDIKKAFREKAKRLHPDIAGSDAATGMRALLTAYEALANADRREAYDRVLGRMTRRFDFDYRRFLREQNSAESRAKLIFFDLLHLEEDEALALWHGGGGLEFGLERYLDREDWMDCAFMLAEELEKRGGYYEAFCLFAALIRQERARPYFRHFAVEVETRLKDLVRGKLRAAVPGEVYLECLASLLGMGFPARDEARWTRTMAEVLGKKGTGNREQGAGKKGPGTGDRGPGKRQREQKAKSRD